MLFGRFEVKIEQADGFKLTASAWGESADQKKHKVRVDVKAVTYHLLEVKQVDSKWMAKVVLDT